MPRMRTLKPEFAKSESIAALPRDVRLHFALLWTYADDDGRGIDNPKLIKAELWPLDDDATAETVEGWQAELERNGRIVRYEADGKRYFSVTNFDEHQKPQKRTDSKHPPPPPPCESRTPTRPLPEVDATETVEVSPVVVVVEGDVDGEVVTPLSPPATTNGASNAQVLEVFDAWRQSTGHTKSLLDDKRRRLIVNALKNYPVADLVDAVRGWKHSAHHRGENDRQTVYNDIGLLLRDASKIEMFRDLERGDRKPTNGKRRTALDRSLENIQRALVQ